MEHIFYPYVDNNICVTATDANGCTNTDAVDVTVNALPAVNPGSNQAICVGDTITLYGNRSVGSNINSNLHWVLMARAIISPLVILIIQVLPQASLTQQMKSPIGPLAYIKKSCKKWKSNYYTISRL